MKGLHHGLGLECRVQGRGVEMVQIIADRLERDPDEDFHGLRCREAGRQKGLKGGIADVATLVDNFRGVRDERILPGVRQWLARSNRGNDFGWRVKKSLENGAVGSRAIVALVRDAGSQQDEVSFHGSEGTFFPGGIHREVAMKSGR